MVELFSVATSLLGVMILAIPFVFVYKYRAKIKRWIKEPTYGDLSTWDVDGIKSAERGVIKAQWRLENANDYLEWKRKKAELQKEPETEG